MPLVSHAPAVSTLLVFWSRFFWKIVTDFQQQQEVVDVAIHANPIPQDLQEVLQSCQEVPICKCAFFKFSCFERMNRQFKFSCWVWTTSYDQSGAEWHCADVIRLTFPMTVCFHFFKGVVSAPQRWCQDGRPHVALQWGALSRERRWLITACELSSGLIFSQYNTNFVLVLLKKEIPLIFSFSLVKC